MGLDFRSMLEQSGPLDALTELGLPVLEPVEDPDAEEVVLPAPPPPSGS